MALIGFDFGTTNSLISVVRGDRAINFLDDLQMPTPSVVCYEGRRTLVGREAKDRLAQAGMGVHGNIVRSPKTLLGKDSVHIEGVERHPVDIVAEVVSHVLREAKASGRGGELKTITGAVVTIPVDMDGRRRSALREAFRIAGLNIWQFVHEPLAALYGYLRYEDLSAALRRYDRKLLLVFDWGGGTLDLTLCRPISGTLMQITNDGTDEVGGDVFDEAIMNDLIKKVCARRGLSESVEIQPGAKARLLARCERAKIELSTRVRTQIYVASFFRGIEDEDFDYSLDQDELETIVSSLIEKGIARITRVWTVAGYAPEQVALCLATGGMSNMPLVRRRLHEIFGPERVQVPDATASLIAEGAAWIASDQAVLKLAKNVELVLARQSYFTIVRAGTAMPRGGEVQKESLHLYCTDPRDGVAKFQICSPVLAGKQPLPNDDRVRLQNLSLKVDAAAKPFRERLELDVSINDDLILTAHARSLNAKDEDRGEIHNLEFALGFPGQLPDDVEGEDDKPVVEQKGGSRKAKASESKGALSIRANVADQENFGLVPGELLYSYDQAYFDIRRNPPPLQDEERLYYAPCSSCGRAMNDPLCKCGSLLQSPRAEPRNTHR